MKSVSTVIRDNNGSVLVEVTIMLTILIVFIFGSVDFLLAFYDWNAAAKAVQVGARIAAVSDPVASNLNIMSAALVSRSLRPGSAMPSFTVTCNGATSRCDCNGACLGGVVVFDTSAMNTIVYGRGSRACGDATSSYTAGMCDVFKRITPANVLIEYRQPVQGGLGYVGRPGGPMPTIKVSLQNVPFHFFFLGFLFNDIKMPSFATTVTGEDLSSCAPMVSACVDTR